MTASLTGDEICAASGCVLKIRCLIPNEEINSVPIHNLVKYYQEVARVPAMDCGPVSIGTRDV